MVCTAHRLQCKTLFFPKHKFPIHTTQNIQPAEIYCTMSGGVGQDHVNPDFADSALLLPLNLYGEKRRPFRWANKTCRALL